jgi:hypothetical protein
MGTTGTGNILLLGLPAAGKTSFLAALYHQASADIEDKKLKEYKMSSDTTYLKLIQRKWLSCEKLDRTINVVSTSTRDVMLHLETIPEGRRFDMHIPDVAGESFMTQFADRLWDITYEAEVRSAGGLVLFIHPGKIKPHVMIDDIQQAAGALEEIDLDEPDAQLNAIGSSSRTNIVAPAEESDIPPKPDASDQVVEFEIENCPTQVVLTDLLLNHLEFYEGAHLNVAIVISAWETVLSNEDHTPEKWLEINLPLLYQYLNCNFERVNYKVFGISAQGGDIENDTDKARLQDCDEPADKVIVQVGKEQNNNICLPIEWIIEKWEKDEQ